MGAFGKNVLFTVIAAIALFAYAYAFELRYLWFIGSKDVSVVRQVEIGVIFAIVALWVFFPSRLAVGALGLFGLVFPPLYDSARFAELELFFVGLIVLHVAFLVGATYARLWARRSAGRGLENST
jgi:hypothetical protein